MRPSKTWGWSSGSPKRTSGPTLGDDMVSVKRTVHDGGSHLQHQMSARRQPAHHLLDIHELDIIIDYATARRCEEPISAAITESTVQWLLHRRMNAQQQMRWSPRGAHLMLKVRTSVVNGTFDRDYDVAERWAHRPFRTAA